MFAPGELKAVASSYDMATAKLVKILGSGDCPQPLLREFALGMYKATRDFPMQLGRIFGITPDYPTRLYLLENIMEEEGVTYSSRNGIEANPRARHLEWIRQFAYSTGLGDAELESVSAAGHNKYLDKIIESDDWISAIAYWLAGIESNTPETFQIIVNGLTRQGFKQDDLAFFINHIKMDTMHGQRAFEILEQQAKTPAVQEQIKVATRRGARDWWLLMDHVILRLAR